MDNNIIITRSSGDQTVYNEEKLRNSLHRAGATHNLIDHIVTEINSKLHKGITTKKIYSMAFAMLRDKSRSVAARYHLKKAIMELGPSGFPFEKFIGEILRRQGYSVKVGEIVNGKCVKHEIDVLAQKNNHQFLIECKYHNHSGAFCDVKVPLYIQSRFLDVLSVWQKKDDTKTYQGWVVTNTRFSNDAIQYGNCAGLHLLGWDYPVKGSLREQIDTLGLYPITCLTTITKVEKQRILDRGIVLCSDLQKKDDLLVSVVSKRTRLPAIRKEIDQLCDQLVKRDEE